MRTLLKKMVILTVMAVLFTAVSQGAVIDPNGWKQSNAYSALRDADNLSNALGMDGTQTYLYNQDGVGGVGETTSANGKEWCTSSNGDEAKAASEGKMWVVFDLGASYDLSSVKIWNFNWDNTPGTPLTSLNDRGTKLFDVWVRNTVADTLTGAADSNSINLNNTSWDQSTELAWWFNLGTSNQWQLALSNQTLAQATNSDTYAGQSFALPSLPARFVAIVAKSHYGGAGMGLGKVRLNGVPHVSAAQESYSGTPWSIPGKIEAENYDTGGQGVAYHDTGIGNNGNAYRSEDVDVQTCSDTGGGYNVGWTENDEWLEYTVNVLTAGDYTLEARVGTPNAGKSFRVEFGGVSVTGDVAVPNTGAWGNWTTVSKKVTLSAGVQVMRFYFNTGGFNLNYLNIIPASTPYYGTAFTLPCRIQAEDFDLGGEGIAYHDTSSGNTGGAYRTTENVDIAATSDTGGGYAVGWMDGGEWLQYTVNVPTAGTYAIRARVSANLAGQSFYVTFDGVNKTGNIGVPYPNWNTTAYREVTLSAGVQNMRFYSNWGQTNLNYFDIVQLVAGDYDTDFDVDTDDFTTMVDEWLNPDMTVVQAGTEVVSNLESGLTGWNVETNSWNGVSTLSLLTGTPTGQALQWTYDNAGGKYGEITYKWTSGINLNSYDRLRMKVKRHAGNSSEDMFFVKFLSGSGYAVAGEMIVESGDALHPATSNNPDAWVDLSFDLSYYVQFPSWSAQANGFYNIGQLTDVRGILIGCGGKSGAGTIDIDDIVLDTYVRDVAESCDTSADWQWAFAAYGAPFGVQDVNDVADPNRGAVVKLHYDDSVANPLGNYSTDVAFVPDLVQSAGPIDLTQYDKIVVWAKYASGNSREIYLYLDIFNGGIAPENFAVEAHVHDIEPTQFYRERGLYPTGSTAQTPADKWLRWDIDLQGARHPLVFQTANGYTQLSQLTAVTAMLIGCTNETTASGQGDIYIDSIELVAKPGCKSLADLTGDCQVTLDDFKILAQNWLKGV